MTDEPAPQAEPDSDVPANGAAPVSAPGTQGGEVDIADSVVAKIVHAACREVDGVHDLGGATSRVFSNLRGGEHRAQGVAVDIRGDSVEIDVTMVVEYGRSIPGVAQECRENVRDRVQSITGLKVGVMNIVVGDIFFPEGGASDEPGQA
jgi:uncharacterized alkaline shock family protein YloU